ncbi:uncharacterized protein LOC142579846 isoform X1 [Dermacentor variabilis]|uniref:uncharacterized protein LOC142573093 isoform X1 n=1 Tax=Dermacentor variabilis TaxID=34621 RepID=UPI003F5BF3C0
MRGRQDQKAASEVADASRRKTDLCSRCSLAASAMLAQGENALATLPSASTVILAQPPWPQKRPGSRCWATMTIRAVGQAEAIADAVSSMGGTVTSSMYRPLWSAVTRTGIANLHQNVAQTQTKYTDERGYLHAIYTGARQPGRHSLTP